MTRIEITVSLLRNPWPSDSLSNWNLEYLLYRGEITGEPGEKPYGSTLFAQSQRINSEHPSLVSMV